MFNKVNIEELELLYPVGTRIRLIKDMEDMQPIEAGTKGTVAYIDGMGTIHMKWDNGRGLGLIVDEDKFEIIS